MNIKENTIVSTTDTKVTLLQWLKSLDKNVTALKEKGIKPSFKIMTADEFIKLHENEPVGVDFAVIQESENDIYVIFGKYEILFNEESKESGSINGTGVIGEVLINDGGNENMYLYGKGWIYFSQQSGIYHFDDFENNEATTKFATLQNVNDVSNMIPVIENTYWHTIKLHNESLEDVQITIVIPSHSNTPVVNQQGFISIGAGDTWGCSGTMALTNDSLEFVTFDNVKFGTNYDNTIFSGTLGRTFTLNQLLVKGISFTDNVKEVK